MRSCRKLQYKFYMESRKESLLKFLESIEEKEVISREKTAESMNYLPEKDIPPINPQVRVINLIERLSSKSVGQCTAYISVVLT